MMKRILWTTLSLTFLIGSLLCCQPVVSAADPSPADPLDWPYWRGPEYNSISRETGLPDTWDIKGGEGSNLAWKSEALGGRSTPVVLRGKIYTIVRNNPATPIEGEKVVAADAATGEIVWERPNNVWSSDVPDTRVGWAPVCGDPETGYIYALGAPGLFQCLNGETGEVVWSSPLHEKLGLLSTYGGRTNVPIVVDDVVVLGSVIIGWGEMARPAHRIIGFDKKTGEIRWFTSTRLLPEDTVYGGPTVAVFKGQKVVLTGSGDGWLYALQPQTGKIVWEYQFSRRGLNVSPTVDGNVIYMGHSEENWDDPENPEQKKKVGAVAAIEGTLTGNVTKSGELWKQLEIATGKGSILKVGDRLYCPDDAGKMFVLDAKTGEPIGRKVSLGTIHFATPVYADGKIYHMEKNGRWYILTPDDEKGVTFKRGSTMGNFPTGDECWSSPVISHGRVYVQTTGALYCFEDKTKTKGSTPRPEVEKEAPVSEDPKPALVQVVPAEVLMSPGEKQQFKVRLFNAKGQLLKETAASFKLDGGGTIGDDGLYTAAADATHSATYVTATAEGMTGTARIRIVPPLPWKFDFEGLKDAPITWVGARYRHVVRQVDGTTVLAKITTIPKGTRSRSSMGPSNLHDYTIQADVKCAVVDNKVPDVGVIAQGYTFEMSGENKWLRINSWIPHDKRYFVSKAFEFVPNTWYTMKLKAANVDGKAVLQAKLWERGQPEPSQWTLEMTDPAPNTTGSPGLFGNATNAEVYIDNVAVTPNE